MKNKENYLMNNRMLQEKIKLKLDCETQGDGRLLNN